MPGERVTGSPGPGGWDSATSSTEVTGGDATEPPSWGRWFGGAGIAVPGALSWGASLCPLPARASWRRDPSAVPGPPVLSLVPAVQKVLEKRLCADSVTVPCARVFGHPGFHFPIRGRQRCLIQGHQMGSSSDRYPIFPFFRLKDCWFL